MRGDCTLLLLVVELLTINVVSWDIINNSNMTSFFRFANKRASYPFGIISLPHAPVKVTDFGSINCNPNNADRKRSIIRVT